MGGEGEKGLQVACPNLPAQEEVPSAGRLSPHPSTLGGGRRVTLPSFKRRGRSFCFRMLMRGVERPRQEGGVTVGPVGTLIWARGPWHTLFPSSPHPSPLPPCRAHTSRPGGCLLIRASHSRVGSCSWERVRLFSPQANPFSKLPAWPSEA